MSEEPAFPRTYQQLRAWLQDTTLGQALLAELTKDSLKSRQQWNPEILDGVPPCDLAAEAGVVGSIILDPTRLSDVAGIVRPTDFHDFRNATLFGHLTAMGAIDTTLLYNRLKTAGDFEKIGGAAYLAEVINSVAVAAHAKHYAKIVREKAALRSLLHLFQNGLRDIMGGHHTAAELMRLVQVEWKKE